MTSRMNDAADGPPRRGVTLVGGRDATARQALVARLRQARLARRQQMSADVQDDSLWLQTGPPADGGGFGNIRATTPALAGPDAQLQAGCICCLGGPVFRTTLVRLLRQPHWRHLYLELNAEPEHVLRVVEQLRSPPFNQYLSIGALLEAVVDADAMTEPPADWASARVTPGGHWRWLDPLPAPPAACGLPFTTTMRLRWPADGGGLPSRQEVGQALEALSAVPGLTGGRAVLQGSRSAHDWRLATGGQTWAQVSQEWRPGADVGPDQENLSAVLRPQETGWRLDNRLSLEMAQGIDLTALTRALHTLQELWR